MGGSSGVSVSSQSCSTDLCNADNAVQSFNLNNFNDFLNSLSNFNAPSYSGPYPLYPTYSAFPSANTGAYPGPYPGYYPGNYPLFGNYAPVYARPISSTGTLLQYNCFSLEVPMASLAIYYVK